MRPYGAMEARGGEEASSPEPPTRMPDKRGNGPFISTFILMVGGAFLLTASSTNPGVPAVLEEPEKASRGKATTLTTPHIVFLLLDDAGYNDFGYASTDITSATPFMDSMANDGVKLTRYYSEHSCTPSRAALFAGQSPILTGMVHENIDVTSSWGMRSDVKILPGMLQDVGYKTYLVGKWDIGHYAPQYWPTERGFDSFLGFLGCCFGDVYKHTTHWVTDFHQDMENANSSFSDEWAKDVNGDWQKGVFATYIFENTAERIVKKHDVSEPMFLMVAFNAPHHPVTVPVEFNGTDDFLQATNGAKYAMRADFAANMRLVDNAAVSIVSAMKSRGIYDNSVIVVTSDNGAPSSGSGDPNGGSNYPFRGFKGAPWEGGMRVQAFVHSPLLVHRNFSVDHMFHVTDWAPTLVEGVARGDSVGLPADGGGVNQWELITNPNATAKRTEIAFLIDYVGGGVGAIMIGDYKFMQRMSCEEWYVPETGLATQLNGVNCSGADGNVKRRIYNVKEDPSETMNLYDDPQYATIQAELANRWCYYSLEVMTDSMYRDSESDLMLARAGNNSDYVTYWKTDVNDTSQYPLAKDTNMFCE